MNDENAFKKNNNCSITIWDIKMIFYICSKAFIHKKKSWYYQVKMRFTSDGFATCASSTNFAHGPKKWQQKNEKQKIAHNIAKVLKKGKNTAKNQW